MIVHLEKNVRYVLCTEKVNSILNAITHDGAFHCHKTLDYSQSFEGKVTKDSKLCFGAVLFLENTVRGGCRSNVAFRSGLRAKEFTLTDLRQDANIYDSFEEFLKGVSL
jgi:hypothetical protein